MTTESTIFDTLKSLVSNRVYPDVAPAGAATPYITYQQVGGEALAYVENTLPSSKNGRYQVNVWATTRAAAAALALQVEAALVQASAFQARAVGAPAATLDMDLSLYGTLQDFTIWSTR
jgi:hypothetical protein